VFVLDTLVGILLLTLKKAKIRNVALIRHLDEDAFNEQLEINYDCTREIIAQMYVNHVPKDIT
jgi:hypothetical protein